MRLAQVQKPIGIFCAKASAHYRRLSQRNATQRKSQELLLLRAVADCHCRRPCRLTCAPLCMLICPHRMSTRSSILFLLLFAIVGRQHCKLPPPPPQPPPRQHYKHAHSSSNIPQATLAQPNTSSIRSASKQRERVAVQHRSYFYISASLGKQLTAVQTTNATHYCHTSLRFSASN